MSRHVEIAGGGIAGLALAAALAQRGCKVRVHERADELRELGVGTTLWGNGLSVLSSLGVLDAALIGATAIETIEVFDEAGGVMRAVALPPDARESYVVLRTSLHRALAQAARQADVEILLNSTIVDANGRGELVRADGRVFAADLAVGAEGYRSAVRDALGLATQTGHVTDALIGRLAVPARSQQRVGRIREYWSGDRCCGVLTCGAFDYIFLSAPEQCAVNVNEVQRGTFDRETWVTTFPVLADHLPAETAPVTWGNYAVVTCRAWSRGRTALLGDAAHAMPSTLAQGAGCALSNGLALAITLDEHDDVEHALAIWEQAVRPATDITQHWAILYLTVLKRWPGNLLPQRAGMIREAFGHLGLVNHFATAARLRVASGDGPVVSRL